MQQRTPTAHVARHIADRTARLLVNTGLLDNQPRREPAFYVLPREERVILIFDPLLKDADRILSQKFQHHLGTALGGRRIVATNSRGIYLQIAYWPPPVTALEPRPLDLTEQPGPLHVPLGLTQRGPLWLPLPQLDAVLIGGSRRMGKTRLLHGWIQALLHGGQAQLILWDGKQGVEFGRYAGQEQVTVANNVNEGLALLTQEMARRARLFQVAHVPALPEYVTATGDRLPALALILDEVAFIPEGAQEALADLVSRGGAFGIYPILATQRPDAEAVKSLVKANLSTRIALPVPAHQDSQVILGRTGAEKLPKEKGRLLLTWEGRLVEVQAFRVEIPEAGASIEEDAAPTVLLAAAERRLVQVAVEELDGQFNINALVASTGESRRWIRKVAQRWEAQGWLTPVQRDPQGHKVGRRVTPALRQAANLGDLVT